MKRQFLTNRTQFVQYERRKPGCGVGSGERPPTAGPGVWRHWVFSGKCTKPCMREPGQEETGARRPPKGHCGRQGRGHEASTSVAGTVQGGGGADMPCAPQPLAGKGRRRGSRQKPVFIQVSDQEADWYHQMLIFSHLPTVVALGASMLDKYDFFMTSNTVILTSALESNLKHAWGNTYIRFNCNE